MRSTTKTATGRTTASTTSNGRPMARISGTRTATNKNRRSNAKKNSKPVETRRLAPASGWRTLRVTAAARALGCIRALVNVVVNLGRRRGGYEFGGEPNEPAVLPGEVWKPYESAKVSSLGRFEDSRASSRPPYPKRTATFPSSSTARTTASTSSSRSLRPAQARDQSRWTTSAATRQTTASTTSVGRPIARMSGTRRDERHRRSTAGPVEGRRPALTVGVVSSGTAEGFGGVSREHQFMLP